MAVATPLRIDGQRPALRTAPLLLGERSREMLLDLSYAEARLADWVTRGILVAGRVAISKALLATFAVESDFDFTERSAEPVSETASIALDYVLGSGCPFAKEDRLTASLAAANHDPALLARLQAQTCRQAFVDRFPAVRPGCGTPRRRWLPFFTGFEVLPLRLR